MLTREEGRLHHHADRNREIGVFLFQHDQLGKGDKRENELFIRKREGKNTYTFWKRWNHGNYLNNFWTYSTLETSKKKKSTYNGFQLIKHIHFFIFYWENHGRTYFPAIISGGAPLVDFDYFFFLLNPCYALRKLQVQRAPPWTKRNDIEDEPTSW